MPKVKVKLNLKDKPDSDLLTFAQAHVTAMTGNANFATPLPSAANFTAALTPYSTALAAFITAQAAAKLATTNKDTARAALENALTARGSYVELTASTAADPTAVVESAGFSVRSSGANASAPAQVQNLSLTAGDSPGEVDAQWDPLPTARTYHVESSPDPMTPTSWTRQKDVTKSRVAVTGLTSGSRVWLRVRGVNSADQGPWSDPGTKIVP